jgi:hypothetical protein
MDKVLEALISAGIVTIIPIGYENATQEGEGDDE